MAAGMENAVSPFLFYKGDGKREEDRTANGADARVVG